MWAQIILRTRTKKQLDILRLELMKKWKKARLSYNDIIEHLLDFYYRFKEFKKEDINPSQKIDEAIDRLDVDSIIEYINEGHLTLEELKKKCVERGNTKYVMLYIKVSNLLRDKNL